jgi:alpha-amylase/alpha-mannosidase (GH57 family)
MRTSALLIVSITVMLTGCLTATGPASADEDVIYLNLMWHQHQPQYYPDPDTGVITRPWVRMHAQKDYYDMAALVAEYPHVHVTFNLTPVLLRQIDQFLDGAKDRYWVLTEKPASELTDEDKLFILERFFDANWDNIIGRFPRYRELLQLRGDGSDLQAAAARFTEQDFRDLQVWFNLAWFDPSFLEQEPLASLVAQDSGFGEDQKAVLFDEALRIMRGIAALHRELQDRGQIEVTTTPYAHPILPLIYDTDLAEENDPAAELPDRFSYPNDAIAHLDRAIAIYTSKFGRSPRGLWPADGAVAQEIVPIVAEAGIEWMASGEQVLAKSLGIEGFTRDEHDTVRQADELYRPCFVRSAEGEPVAIVFRDLRLSDHIGFEYSGTPAAEAVDDFISRIERIGTRLAEVGAEGPHLVSVILDGENAWEYYPNDGIEFLRGLYEALSESESIQTITPSEYLRRFPDQRVIDDLWPGCWFSPDFSTWIGEPEETLAWEYLEQVRGHLARYDIQASAQATEEQLQTALDSMYLAEGSDWFWWYGSDQDSGVDEYFDEGFRALLRSVYVALGDEVPRFIDVPIIPERPARPEQAPRAPAGAVIDGEAGADEWDGAGYYQVRGGAMTQAQAQIAALYYGYSDEGIVFRIDGRTQWADFAADYVSVYLSIPGRRTVSPLAEEGAVLGFRAAYALRIDPHTGEGVILRLNASGDWLETVLRLQTGIWDRTIEAAVTMNVLAEARPGDTVDIKAVMSESGEVIAMVPASGPARMVVPGLGNATPVLSVGDDHGPGNHTYPTDPVFIPGSFDITQFDVAHTDENIVFTFAVNAPIDNPWGSPIDLSLQTFDIYLDVDADSTGASELLEGRNARLAEPYGWDVAIWIEGWNQKLIVPDAEGRLVELSGNPTRVIVDGPNGAVSIFVPRTAIEATASVQPLGQLEQWRYLGMVLSQEGYPSAGVRRVRDVETEAAQWRLGGGSGEGTDTRVLDVALPEGAPIGQEAGLHSALPMVTATR